MAADESKPNPFSAPVADPAESVAELAANGRDVTLGQIAKRVFLEWEKLRLLYIGILAVVTLVLGWSHVNRVEFWFIAVVGGVVSNVCFFIGPIVETYVTWLGFRSSWMRWVFFVLGTLFTLAFAVGAMVSMKVGSP